MNILQEQQHNNNRNRFANHYDESGIKQWLDNHFPNPIKWKGAQGTALCPFHNDHNPSFSINAEKGVWHCFAGCGSGTLTELAERIGIPLPFATSTRDPNKQSKKPRRKTKVHEVEYIYTDAQGNPVLMVGRDGHGKDKKFSQYHFKNGEWWVGKGDTEPIPYNLPHILVAIHNGETVFVVEGEKDADTLWDYGFVATTSANGGGNWPASKDFNKHFKGAKVVILPDNDEAGKRHAEQVAYALKPYAASIKVVSLPGLPEHGDVTDWLNAGHTSQELMELVEQAGEWQPVPDKLVPFQQEGVMLFPVEIFPEPLQRFVMEGSASLNCPLDFIGMPMLAVAGECIGKSFAIQPKEDWIEYARIWSVIVGEPGSGKTPALEMVLEPIKEIQHERAKKYHAQMAEYDNAIQEWAKDKNSPKPPHPVMEQLYTTDTTVEALAEVLSDSPRGLLIYQEEIAGFVRSFNQYKGGKGSDKQTFLSLWSGSPIMVNRRQRRIYIHDPFVGIVGGIQPGTLSRLRNEMTEEDGFVHRFLIVNPELPPKKRTEAVVSQKAKSDWEAVCRALTAIQPDGEGKPYTLGFTPDGLEAWHSWLDAHYEEQNSDEFPDSLRGPWAKLETYSLRLALIIHVLRVVCGEIPEDLAVDSETMRRNAILMDYIKSHSRKVYAELRETPEDKRIRLAVTWLNKRGGEASIRDLQRANVAGVRNLNDAQNLIHLLENRGCAKAEKTGRSHIVKLIL